jgi:hypothetical protein
VTKHRPHKHTLPGRIDCRAAIDPCKEDMIQLFFDTYKTKMMHKTTKQKTSQKETQEFS